MIENWKDVQIVPEFCDQGVDCYRLEGGDTSSMSITLSQKRRRES